MMSNAMFTRSHAPADIQFYLNGHKHEVSDKFAPTTTLNDYIREVAGLTGTKVMCKEAGCGCCAVTVTHALDGEAVETMSINSCVCPLYSVDGWYVSTTEGLGSQKTGLHPIQQRIVDYNGSQCGYCTPGVVMSMYGLLNQNPRPSMKDIEGSLDGLLCRCTGYRSILDAMKSFGVDSPSPAYIDIEDLGLNLCPKTGGTRHGNCSSTSNGTGSSELLENYPRSLNLDLHGSRWFRPLTLKQLGEILTQNKTHSIKMVFGNTASGIFKHQGPYEVYIDLRSVKELHIFKDNHTSLVFGAGTTIGKFKKRLLETGERPGFHYFRKVVRHLNVLASTLVRNAGSIAGNLMIKHANPWFPSDLFTMLEAVGAQVSIYDSESGGTTKHSLLEFLKEVKMDHKVILSVEVPHWKSNTNYRSFKITPRWQNSHAYINAAFKIPIDEGTVAGRPNLVFGGVSGEMVHASDTETFLENKILDNVVIKAALRILHEELQPDVLRVGGSPGYKKQLCVNLLYKSLLELYQPSLRQLQSGALSLERPLSSGLQTYQTKSDKFPLGQAATKMTAPLQATGEAKFTNDMPIFKKELQAAFVLSSVGIGKIVRIDTSKALQIPGVVGFIGPEEIPPGGANNFIPANYYLYEPDWKDELFATEKIDYAGRPIGLILAESQILAEQGARAVNITYKDVERPVMDLKEAIQKNMIFEKATEQKVVGDAEAALEGAAYVVEGECEMGNQYYFYIENQVALSVPSEDGIDVYSATQCSEMAQRSVSQLLGKPMNYCNMIVSRLGGGFGGKFLHSCAVAAASAVAAEVTGRPVRLRVDLSTDMQFNGKRFPILAKYKAGCNSEGKLMGIVVDIFVDAGHVATTMTFDVISMLDQGYFCPNWRVTMKQFKTNKVCAGPTRGPGQVPACMMIETIMEHLALEAKRCPVIFRELNLFEEGQKNLFGTTLTHCPLRKVWGRLKQIADVQTRLDSVVTFNQNNLWRKKGLSMTTARYDMCYYPTGFPTHVSVFAADGTVCVITAGVEMGQGLYMKVAQAVAYSLKVPLDFVKVRPNQNNVTANPLWTGGSISSERCVASAMVACEKINRQLQPFREKLPDADWKTLLQAAWKGNADLSAVGTHHYDQRPVDLYATYMAGVVETEVDVLTGESQINRVDLLGDFGDSMNPTIDIGQVEGAYVMGLGAFLTEDLFFSKDSGKLLNDGTWEYKPPTTKDIPIDWRIHFLPDTPNPVGVLSSKAAGEPPIGLAMGALLSVKKAVESVREDLTGERVFIPVAAPFTVEKAQLASGIQVKHLNVEERCLSSN